MKIVFCNTENKEFDSTYAETLKDAFRKLTGWKVEKDTRIDKDLEKFSLGYSKEKRDVREVASIFAIANNIL